MVTAAHGLDMNMQLLMSHHCVTGLLEGSTGGRSGLFKGRGEVGHQNLDECQQWKLPLRVRILEAPSQAAARRDGVTRCVCMHQGQGTLCEFVTKFFYLELEIDAAIKIRCVKTTLIYPGSWVLRQFGMSTGVGHIAAALLIHCVLGPILVYIYAGAVKRTKLCHCEMPANDVMRRNNNGTVFKSYFVYISKPKQTVVSVVYSPLLDFSAVQATVGILHYGSISEIQSCAFEAAVTSAPRRAGVARDGRVYSAAAIHHTSMTRCTRIDAVSLVVGRSLR
ncbi:hypothetical protein EVAR_54285_1 [Eumeta japonica]|uniref:Uncharacterized protein n=1 Tax=Eumeta variegata TaxID=151549 RepID=A0A4C1YN62_EUMVA|nr:hypothetical protein EVAR_54285_1 [Eumeta japonica]